MSSLIPPELETDSIYKPDKIANTTWETENLVFDRDEYAKKEFWDDRFRE